MLQNKHQTKVRDSSIELLRIISMLMIVFHHFAIHGGFEFGTSLSIPLLWYNFILMGGKVGVNVFVLITGYYLINNTEIFFDLNKILKFIGQVFFYSAVIFIIGLLTGYTDLSLKSFLKAFFPITFSQWWFASTYFVLYLLHPYINITLHNIGQSLYQKLLFLLIICWSVIPTFTTSLFQSNSLLWFITLYAISGYIRLYGFNNKFTAKHYFFFFLICSLLTYLSSVIFTVLGSKWHIFSEQSTYFYRQEKLTTFLIALSLFMSFATLKFNYYKWINILASSTFGVYLIHDNNVGRTFLWLKIFQNARYQESLFLIPYSIIVVIIVYIVCSCIDLLRQRIIEMPFMMIVKHFLSKKIISLEKAITLLKHFIFET